MLLQFHRGKFIGYCAAAHVWSPSIAAVTHEVRCAQWCYHNSIMELPLINNANVLQGAIIGGIIGNSLRGGSKVRNRNTGAIIGAFIGANQSSGNNSTRVENRCHTVNRRNAYQVVEQYWLDIRVHGTTIRRSIYAKNNRPNVRIGQQIDVMVNYSVN